MVDRDVVEDVAVHHQQVAVPVVVDGAAPSGPAHEAEAQAQQPGAHARPQIAGAERLRNVVESADVERLADLRLLVLAGEEDDRQLALRILRP